MADIRAKTAALTSLEQLAAGHSLIHRVHPAAKLLGTAVYLLCLLSLGRYDLTRLTPYLLYPALLLPLSDTPCGMVLRRAAVALPFCLFAGVSGVFFDPYGVLALAVLVLRTLLSVSAVLLLVAVTPLSSLTAQLRRWHVPALCVSLLEMTYRYIGTLLDEAATMYTAYRLRGSGKKGLEMRHMGSFVGGLLLRSFDRAERIYQAMQCRGYPAAEHARRAPPLAARDAVYLVAVCGSSMLFRLIDLPTLLGRMF